MSCPPRIGYIIEDRGYKTACWIWQGKKNKYGYGRIKRGGKEYMAHRYMYEQKHGPVPGGLELDHLCRQRACMNDEHLEAVTPSVNKQRGDVTPFTPADIASIIERYRSGESQHKIAKFLSVRQGTISRILAGQRWGNIVVPVQARSPIKITREQAREIALLCSRGVMQKAVARQFGIGPSQVSRIARGESWGLED
jgi:predicted transcriptional regulator